MDRLIIEAALSDVNEIFLETKSEEDDVFDVVLGFNTVNTEQIIHAFSELKDISINHAIQLVICKTMVSGMYDLDLKSDFLDEPIRIMNKTIDNEILSAIESRINANQRMALATNISGDVNSIPLSGVHIRECEMGL